MSTDYTGRYTTTVGTSIDVAANRGVQATGYVTGRPQDATEPGDLLITATSQDNAYVVLATDVSEAHRLIRSIEIGIGVAQTRNHNNDQHPPVNES